MNLQREGPAKQKGNLPAAHAKGRDPLSRLAEKPASPLARIPSLGSGIIMLIFGLLTLINKHYLYCTYIAQSTACVLFLAMVRKELLIGANEEEQPPFGAFLEPTKRISKL